MKKTGLLDAMDEFDPGILERQQSNFSAAPGLEQRGDITVRLPRTVRQSLRQLALDRDTTVQQLMVEAINTILVQHGRTPIL